MPDYVITAPDGRKFKVTGQGSREEALSAVRQQLSARSLSGAAGKSASADQRGSIIDPFMQGLVPFADEIAGGVGGAIHMARGKPFKEGYERTRGTALADYEAYKARNPGTAMAAEVVGAIPGAMLPIGTVARGANLASKVGRGAAVGAGYGAAYGAGHGDGLGERVYNAAAGAVTGGAVGGALPLAGRAASKAVSKVKGAFGRPQVGTRAGNLILDDLAAEGLSVDDAARAARGYGPQGMLADASPTLRFRAEQIAQSDNPARSGVITALKGRSGGAVERIGNAYDDALGFNPNVFQTLETMKATRKANADPLYKLAYRVPIRITKALDDFLKTPSGKRASAEAVSLAKDENFALSPIPTNTRGWNYIKHALDDMIDSSMEADSFGRTKATNKTRILTRMKEKILNEIDSQNSTFKKARAQFSDDISVEKAFGRGADIFKSKTHPDFFRNEISKMSEAEKDALKLGVRSAVDEAMGRVRNGSLKGRQLLDSDFNERKIIAVLGEPDGRKLIDALTGEQAMAETANQALGNSATSRRLDNPFRLRGTGVTSEQKGILRNALNLNFGDAAARVGEKILGAVERRGARSLADEVAPLLTAQGSRREALIRALMDFDVTRARGQSESANVEALANALLGTAGRSTIPALASP